MDKLKLILLVFLFFSKTVLAQDSNIKNRINFKVNYSSGAWLGDVEWYEERHTPRFTIESNYRLLKYVETGIYLGYSPYETLSMNKDTLDAYLKNLLSANSFSKNTVAKWEPLIYYGLNTNFHFLPLFTKTDDFRFDFYISAKIGGLWFVNKGNLLPRRVGYIDYSIGGGLVFYLNQHWGLYGEYGIGNFQNWRAGISLKF